MTKSDLKLDQFLMKIVCMFSLDEIVSFFIVLLQTPLHRAAYVGQKECVKILLQYGADKSLKAVRSIFFLVCEIKEVLNALRE